LVRDLYGRFIHIGYEGAGFDGQLGLTSARLPFIAPGDRHRPQCVELEQNTVLTDYRVHDLNADPMLPLPQNAYDVVVCTGSVEYLTSPQAVFDQVARVLRPGGHFIVTFSNRWFPPKVVAIWSQLHEFERMGLVLEYFRQQKHSRI
jgi:SAM-dependent methyltransferase